MIQHKGCNFSHLRIIIIVCILSLVASTIDSSTVHTSTPWRNVISSSEQNLFIDGITSAKSSYEYGIQVGQKYSPQYHLLTTLVWRDRTIHLDARRVHQIENLEHDFEYFFPNFLEELQGLAHGTNIPMERLIEVQLALSDFLRGECTVTLSTGKATKYNQTFLTFNIDASVDTIPHIFFNAVLHRLFSLRCRMVRINTLEYRYAYWGVPILYEIPFLNEKGLGWGSPGTLLTKENRTIDEGAGIATMLLEKLAMMTCKNVSQVASLYKNIERASQKGEGWFHMYDGSTSCFCDSEGGILAIEQTHSYIITVFGNSTEITGAPEGILWHANHHQWLDPLLTGSIYPSEDASSAFRAERARDLLEKNYGNITLEVCKEIVRDHGGGFDPNGKDSGDICRHPDGNSKKVTAFSWIVLPKDLTVYWTHTSPCKGIFWKRDFSKIFA